MFPNIQKKNHIPSDFYFFWGRKIKIEKISALKK
jgi:hypothetical protein